MTFYTEKTKSIRNTIFNVKPLTAFYDSASKEQLQCFTTIEQKELNKCIIASKPNTFLLDQ